MNVWRQLVAGLLFIGAVATLLRVAGAGTVGRLIGVLAIAALVTVALAVYRSRDWAYGAAFLLGVCWFWAVIALRVQGVLLGVEVLLWFAWSVLMIVGSVMSRPPRRFGPPDPGLRQDRSDG